MSSTPSSGKPKPRKPRSRFDPGYELLLKRLIAAREQSGVTQVAIARALGKTQSHVSMCENRDREISIMDLLIWCRAVGLDPSDLIRAVEAEMRDSNT